MKRSGLVIAALGLAGVAVVVLVVKQKAPPLTPDQVVLRSFELLREADFDALRGCYSERAWQIVAKSLPPAEDSAAVGRLKQYMAGLSGIRIEATTYRGDTADVEVMIERDQSDEREVFHLVQAGDAWLID